MSWELTIYTNELIDQKDVRIKHVSTNYIQVKGPYKNKVKEQLFLDALHLTVSLLVPYLCMDLSLVCNWWIHALFEHLSDL